MEKYYTPEIEDSELEEAGGGSLSRGAVFDYLNINMCARGYQIVPYEILEFLAKYSWDLVSILQSSKGYGELQNIVAKRKNYGK